MASFNVSLDDSSPLISYSPAGAWVDTPNGDSLAQQYQSHSLHSSSSQGATATFKFNGTGVWLFGGKRSNYGTFSLSVDGNVISSGTASASTAATQQLLAGTGGLSMGEHTAVFSNSGTGAVDLDSILFEAQMGATNGTVSYSVIESGDARISYSGSDWASSSNAIFSNGATQFTGTNGATTSVAFAGDAVAVYGGSSFDHGNYTVSLDGVQHQFNGGSNGQVAMYHPQALLFFASNLGNGSHTLTVTNNAIGNATLLDVDQIGVYKSPSYTNDTASGTFSDIHVHQADANMNSAGASSASTGSQGLSKSALAAIVASCMVGALLIIGLIIFFLLRSKKRKQAKKDSKNTLTSPVLPIQDPEKGLEPYDGAVASTLPKQRSLGPSGAPGGIFVNFPTQPDLNRQISTRTTDTRWSQGSESSMDSTETLRGYASPKLGMPEPSLTTVSVLPPVAPLSITRPPLPTPPVIPMPPALQQRERSGSVSSASSDESRRTTMYGDDDDDFASYYRQSVASEQHLVHQQSGVPTRPPRPPGLDLHSAEFSSVPL